MDRIAQTELDLVGFIYDTVLHPELWDDTIDRIRRYVGLYLGAIGVNYIRGGHAINATSNIPPGYLPIMNETADSIFELWGGPEVLPRLPLEEPLRMLDYSTPDMWPGNPFYERFCKPLGLADQIVLILEHTQDVVGSFALGRHESMPEIDEDQLGTFSNLAPHMRRAVLISDLLEARSMVASSFEATLDGIASAVLLVDPNARITYANPRAEAMLRDSETITQLNGRLLAPRELVKGHLERTVAAASQPGETVGPASGIPVRRQDGTGQVIHVLPLERRADRPSPGAVAAVFVAEPNAALNLPLEAIRALYDLRPAEMRTLQFVASGLSAKAVAEALSVSESTAKTHTLRLFDKLGVHTRAELVSFVRNMSLGN